MTARAYKNCWKLEIWFCIASHFVVPLKHRSVLHMNVKHTGFMTSPQTEFNLHSCYIIIWRWWLQSLLMFGKVCQHTKYKNPILIDRGPSLHQIFVWSLSYYIWSHGITLCLLYCILWSTQTLQLNGYHTCFIVEGYQNHTTWHFFPCQSHIMKFFSLL